MIDQLGGKGSHSGGVASLNSDLLLQYLKQFYSNLINWLSGLGTLWSIVIFIGVTVVVTVVTLWIILWLPANQFVACGRGEKAGGKRSARHWAVKITRNVLGLFVVLPLGIIMALPLVPGPGIVFIALGLSLVDFPGKRKLQARLLSKPSVQKFVNNLRTQFGKAPFDVDDLT